MALYQRKPLQSVSPATRKSPTFLGKSTFTLTAKSSHNMMTSVRCDYIYTCLRKPKESIHILLDP